MNEKIILKKYMSREHSLFYCYVWRESNQKCRLHMLSPVKNILFLKNGKNGKTSVWYDRKEYVKIYYGDTAQRFIDSPGFFNEIKDAFFRYWKKLEPYVKEEKEISSLEELKEFYENWIMWWSPMAYNFVLPNVETTPKKIRDEALKIRAETEKYSDTIDSVFVKYFVKEFPEYEEYVNVMTPYEIFSLRDRRLTVKELEKIRNRLDGFVFLNGKLYGLEDLNNTLKKEGVVLEEMKTILTKYYSRERTITNAILWLESDKIGFSNWLGIKLEYALFIHPKPVSKTSVWYNKEEYENIKKVIGEKFAKNPEIFEKMKVKWHHLWDTILPYLKREKELKDIEEYKSIYEKVVLWWSVMVITYYIPDIKEISGKIREEAIKLREESELHSDNCDTIFIEYLEKNCPGLKELIPIILPEEAYKFVKKELSPEEIENIKKRVKGYFLLNEEIHPIGMLEEILEKNNLVLESGIKQDTAQLKGTVACKGLGKTFKGKTKLILSKDQIHSLQEGEILVTEMTSPDYLPAMKKSSAIITDEGGVTCHAAIVSREMNKLCIIGTKIATSVLKDGDLVEIDANKGVVKILKEK